MNWRIWIMISILERMDELVKLTMEDSETLALVQMLLRAEVCLSARKFAHPSDHPERSPD